MPEEATITDQDPPPLVSVIIPCHDATWLGATLDSLTRQTYTGPWEVLIADNHSGGAAAHAVAPFAGRLPGLRVVAACQGRGPAYARNVGAAQARGHCLLFIDADDTVSEGYLAAMVGALDAADLVCARIDILQINAGDLGHRQAQHPQFDGLLIEDFRYLPFAAAGSLGVRRSAFDRLGGFNERRLAYEEADFCWRLQRAGFTGPVLVRAAVLHSRRRATARAAYRQGRAWGAAQVDLVADGDFPSIRRPSPPRALAAWKQPLTMLLRARCHGDLINVAWITGLRVGRLAGSLRRRVYFP